VSSGRVWIGGVDVTDRPPAARGLAMVFQSYALFPHLDVRENIVFGLKVRRVPAADRERRLRPAAHWNNFLWPLVITNSVETRPVTVGLAIFAAPETGVNWAVISAGTLLSVAELLLAFLLFQRQFVQSFMRAGIK
jgi:ABC-type sugar transport system ATPase subunit